MTLNLKFNLSIRLFDEWFLVILVVGILTVEINSFEFPHRYDDIRLIHVPISFLIRSPSGLSVLEDVFVCGYK